MFIDKCCCNLYSATYLVISRRVVIRDIDIDREGSRAPLELTMPLYLLLQTQTTQLYRVLYTR